MGPSVARSQDCDGLCVLHGPVGRSPTHHPDRMSRSGRPVAQGADMARLSIADLGRLLRAWLGAGLALAVAVEVLPGLTATSAGPLVVAAAVSRLVGVIVRPLLVGIAARFG